MAYGTLFQSLIDKVVIETNRPDLALTRIPQAVLSATLAMHTLDFFPKDLLTADVVFDNTPTGTPAYIQTLDTAVLPRIRALAYVRKWDPSFNSYELVPSLLPPLSNNILGIPVCAGISLAFMEIITPDDIIDDYGYLKQDVAYLAGDQLVMKSSTALPMAKLGWYAFPATDIENGFANYQSWVASQYPFTIVYEAAASVFGAVGMNEAANSIRRPPEPKIPGDTGGPLYRHVQTLLMGSILAKGY